MTADQRLDQLEPLLVQSLATLDQHTAQNERHTAQLKVVINAVAQQSDTIGFLLREVVDIKTKQAIMKTDITGIRTEQTGMSEKLDLILNLLSNQNK